MGKMRWSTEGMTEVLKSMRQYSEAGCRGSDAPRDCGNRVTKEPGRE